MELLARRIDQHTPTPAANTSSLKGVDIMPKESAIRYLSWYFKLLFQKTGMQWDESNDADIECFIDLIIDAAVEKLKTVSPEVAGFIPDR